MTLLTWLACAALLCFAAAWAVAAMALRELRSDGPHRP
jgi:hypothetical protein